MTLKQICVTLLFVVTLALHAQEYNLEKSLNNETGVYKKGEEAVYKLQLFKDGKPAIGKTITYQLFGDNGFVKKEVLKVGEKEHEIKISLDFPAWVTIRAWGADADGAHFKNTGKGKIYFHGGIIFSPDEIKPADDEPKDFDEFWDKAKAELALVPMRATRVAEELPDHWKDKIVCYDVKIDCTGQVPCSGYLTIPKNAKAKSLPIILQVHGAGVRSAVKNYEQSNRDEFIVEDAIVFDLNAHGILNGQSKSYYNNLARRELAEYMHKDKNDKNRFYFRAMYMRLIRALEYIKSLPEWDGENLIVIGASQGGAQAIVATALDPQISYAIIGVPALCDHSGNLANPPRQCGWPRLANIVDGKSDNPQVTETARYFDCVHFAKRIKSEVCFSCGLADTTCPPSGVFATYNNIPEGIKKDIVVAPWGDHGVPHTKGFARLHQILDEIKAKRASK